MYTITTLLRFAREHVAIINDNLSSPLISSFIVDLELPGECCVMKDHKCKGSTCYVIKTHKQYRYVNLCPTMRNQIIDYQKALYTKDIISYRAKMIGKLFIEKDDQSNSCRMCSVNSNAGYKYGSTCAHICDHCKQLSVNLFCVDVMFILNEMGLLRDIQVYIAMCIRDLSL